MQRSAPWSMCLQFSAVMLAWPAVAFAADAASATICQSGGVEMILGGSTNRPCQHPAGASPRRPTVRQDDSGHQIPRSQQLTRDQERVRILEAELQQELAGLARLQRTGHVRDAAALVRVQDNIAALNRELAGAASQQVSR